MTRPPRAAPLVTLLVAVLLAMLATAPAAHAQREFPGGIHPKHDDRIGPRLPRPGRAPGGPDSAAAAVALALFAGTLPGPDGAAPGEEVQRALLRLMTTPGEDDEAWLVERLARPGNQGAQAEARALARQARGLLASPQRVRDVVAAYNAFVNASAMEFLRDPPPEFLAAHSVLARLAGASRVRAR